jgi:hypothetical protein
VADKLFQDAAHLPNQRGGRPADPDQLPRQRRGTTPQMHGRYPDYDVLEEAGHWDEVTRRVVMQRLEAPPIRFFGPAEVRTLGALCDLVTAQHRDPRVPVLAMIDRKMHAREFDGFRYAWMPDDAQTWRLVAQGLDEAAAERHAESFAGLPLDDQRELCGALADGELAGGAWETIDPKTAWKVITRGIVSAFYSHPWAWNEIGYAGPAYPRGFARLGVGMSEAWEAVEAVDIDPVEDVG